MTFIQVVRRLLDDAGDFVDGLLGQRPVARQDGVADAGEVRVVGAGGPQLRAKDDVLELRVFG